MKKRINQAQQIFFILLGVAIPTSIAITNILILILTLCWLAEGGYKNKLQKITSTFWLLSIFGLILLYVLGLFWGDNHINVLWQFQRLGLLLFFPVLVTTQLTQKTIRNAVVAFLTTNFIAAIIALAINCNILDPLGQYFSIINSNWTISAFIKYNYHNVLLALSFTLSLYILINKKTKYQKILLFFMMAYALSIFTERGRAGQVIFNISSLFYIIYYNRSSFLKLILWIFLLFLFQYTIYKTTKVFNNRFQVVTDIVKNNGYREGQSRENIRYLFLRESFNKICEKPLLGYGTGSFGTIFDKEIKTGHNFFPHTTPHNQYLYVWFELGIFGLVLLLLIFYFQIKELFRKQDGVHRSLLPFLFLFLMMVDSYFFIFILTIAYIYLYTIYCNFQEE